MPCYTYKCAHGHEQDVLCKYEDRPEFVACEHTDCFVAAREVPSAPYTVGIGHRPGLKTQAREVGSGTGVRDAELVCESCDHRFHDALLRSDPIPPCPRCTSLTVREVIGFPHTTSIRYPYFCHGMGVMVNSPQHRLDLAKERGLVPWEDTSASVIDQIERGQSRKADDDAAVKAKGDTYYKELDEHPKYAEYREMKDKGVFDDQIKEALGELHDGDGDIDLTGADDATLARAAELRTAEETAPIVVKTASPAP